MISHKVLGVLLLIESARCLLVCYECGLPGTMTCEDAFSAGLVLGVPCASGSCIATSFVYGSGERVRMKSCNKGGSYSCSKNQSRKMNFNTCETCSTSFCNGPLPSCSQQLKFIPSCMTSQAVVNQVIVLSLLALLAVVVCVAVKKFRDSRQDRDQRVALVARFYSQDALRRSYNLADMNYTQI